MGRPFGPGGNFLCALFFIHGCRRILLIGQVIRYPDVEDILLFPHLDLNVEKLTVRLDDVQCQKYCGIKFLPDLSKKAWFATSNGLKCASTIFDDSDHNRNIYLWNPLIQKYKTLPDSPVPSPSHGKLWEALAFGFVPELIDYVVVHIIKPYLRPNRHSIIIGVYSLNTNSWKECTDQDNVFISKINSSEDEVVFVNAAAIWVGVNSEKHKILLRFDTKTNILTEISLPDWIANRSLVPIPVIHLFGQSIAYFVWEDYESHFDMWVLKDDPTNEFTWEKKMCVCLSEFIMLQVLGVRNNGGPILVKSYNLISYNLDNHEANDFVDSWRRWTEDSAPPYVISPFVESLGLLNID
ncbi:F-box domain-containing protein [Heracleum sosnowskyi]|uniref:F-box domain-containing protein n=1 Tax=Heracleum sosnowskyi TaxID=360622 RepID=A0AAD8HQQ3_9APIA|nr:F-box domain-containing protein [Heracleum sosnowskyi]KAK1371669.1 F-box domain-containing protein [Heracleum sosnowskyi]KAK1371674.1 F-box domain-containing protein [Heracleum sosnowskyi]